MQNCASPTGQRDQKIISPTSYSREVFYSDTSPLSSPHPTGASAFASSSYSGRLKHSHSLGARSPKGLTPRSRGLSSVEERDEIETERRCSASLVQMKFYKRTRSVKEPRELSSPKKTEETFPKAKEQHHTPQQSAIQAQKVTAGKNGTTTTQSASSVKPTQAGKQSSSSLGQQDPLSRSKDVPSEVHGKRNGRGGNLEVRRHPRERGPEAAGERTRPSSDKNTPRERTDRGSLHQRAPPRAIQEAEVAAGKSSRQREANQKATEVRSTSKEQSNNRDSHKDAQKQRSAVVSPREAQGRQGTLSHSKDGSSKEVRREASVNSIPEAMQSPKGTLSPGPWKTPSSAKILSHAEVLRDPL